MTNRFKATFTRGDVRFSTRWYPTTIEAQEALWGRAGWFNYLGGVAGDVFEGGLCTTAPRNGGLVSILEREVAHAD
jgi:hypothetical protein